MTPQEQAEALKRAQRAKKNDLNAYVSRANGIITEINKLNEEIRQAKDCRSKASQIAGLVNDSIGDLGSVGHELQLGLKIDGKPQGVNCSEQSLSIPAGINSQVNSISTKVSEYVMKKNSEALLKKTDVEKISRDFNFRLMSYPTYLGPYGPAPTFPTIPEVELPM